MAKVTGKLKTLVEEQRRNIILDAFAQIILEEGIEGVTTNKIAQKAGIATGTLYNYFQDKEEMQQAFLCRCIEVHHEKLRHICRKKESARKRLFRITEFVLNSANDEAQIYRILLSSMLPSKMYEIHQRYEQESIELIVQLIREGCVNGEFFTDDPETLVIIYRGALKETVNMIVHNFVRGRISDKVEFIIECLFKPIDHKGDKNENQ